MWYLEGMMGGGGGGGGGAEYIFMEFQAEIYFFR